MRRESLDARLADVDALLRSVISGGDHPGVVIAVRINYGPG
jgi:hypothetical protein